jgi:3-deoxy-D-manno-octulosonic acid kinase
LTLRDGGDAFVRRYVHGGLLGALLGDRYWQRPSRPLRELLATEAARAAGVVAPEVLAAVVQPAAAGGLLYRGVLVTRALAGRRALADALRAATDDDGRRRWIACAVGAVRRLHAAGIRHPDLNVTNVLVGVRPEDDAALIDFDRARVGTGPVGAAGVALARRRLSRSIAKLGLPGLDRAGAAAALDAAGLGASA